MRTVLGVLVVGVVMSASALAQDGAFTAPEGTRAPRLSGRIVDCAGHGGWIPPEGWNVSRDADGNVLAIESHGRAILIRVQTRTRTTHVRTTEDFRRIATEVTARWAPGATFAEVTENARSRWHIDRRVEGTVGVRGTPMTVIAESNGERELWVALVPTSDTALRAAIDTAMASYALLTDHACACGYDCDHRPAAP